MAEEWERGYIRQYYNMSGEDDVLTTAVSTTKGEPRSREPKGSFTPLPSARAPTIVQLLAPSRHPD